MLARNLLPLSLLFLGACSASAADDAVTNAAAESAPATTTFTDAQIVGSDLAWGVTSYFTAVGNDFAGVHGWGFKGQSGDQVVGWFTGSHGLPCNAHVLQQTANGWVSIAELPGVGYGEQALVKVTLVADGNYALAFELTGAPPTDTATHYLNAVFEGIPVSPRNQFVYDVHRQWQQSMIDGLSNVDPSTLKGDALAKFTDDGKTADQPPRAAAWSLDGQTVTVIHAVIGGDIYEDLFDADGNLLASGTNHEWNYLRWTK